MTFRIINAIFLAIAAYFIADDELFFAGVALWLFYRFDGLGNDSPAFLFAAEKRGLLINSIIERNAEVLEAALLQGYEVNFANERGISPVHYAAFGGDPKMLNMLLEKGAAADVGSAATGFSSDVSLHGVVRAGDLGAPALGGAGRTAEPAVDLPRPWHGVTPLMAAASAGNVKCMRLLISWGAKPDTRDSIGAAPLHYAVAGGHDGAAAFLIEAGAKSCLNDPVSPSQATPLMLAALRCSRSTVRLLIRHGADISHRDAAGNSAIDYAARASDPGNGAELAAAGATVDAENGCDPAAAAEFILASGKGAAVLPGPLRSAIDERPMAMMAEAVKRDYHHLAGELMAKGVLPDAPVDGRDTPLTLAAAKGAARAMSVLIESALEKRGRDALDDRAPSGETPLISAIKAGFHEGIRSLVSAGASVSATGAGGMTPLMQAAASNDHVTAALLVKAGAITKATDDRGRTALSFVEFSSQPGGPASPRDLFALEGRRPNREATRLVRILTGAGAPAGSPGAGLDGSVLHAAVSAPLAEAVETLVHRGANVDAANSRGETPLIIAARCGNADIVRFLLNKNADIDAVDAGGSSALIEALRYFRGHAAKLLIERGANVNIRAVDGKTAFGIARSKNLNEIMELLRKKGAVEES